MDKTIEFKDFSFKLAVINKLMNVNEIIEPGLGAWSFIEKLKWINNPTKYWGEN